MTNTVSCGTGKRPYNVDTQRAASPIHAATSGSLIAANGRPRSATSICASGAAARARRSGPNAVKLPSSSSGDRKRYVSGSLEGRRPVANAAGSAACTRSVTGASPFGAGWRSHASAGDSVVGPTRSAQSSASPHAAAIASTSIA